MKGQISLDLILTFIIVLIFVSSTTIISSNIKENYEKIILENQLQEHANNYANFITMSQTLTDTNFLTKIPLKKIYYNGLRIIPDVNLNENIIELKIKTNNDYEKIVSANFINNKINIKIINGDLVVTNE